MIIDMLITKTLQVPFWIKRKWSIKDIISSLTKTRRKLLIVDNGSVG